MSSHVNRPLSFCVVGFPKENMATIFLKSESKKTLLCHVINYIKRKQAIQLKPAMCE